MTVWQAAGFVFGIAKYHAEPRMLGFHWQDRMNRGKRVYRYIEPNT